MLTLGANLQSVRTHGRHGLDEITLSYDDVDRYLDPEYPYFGPIIGRVANRIAGGAFELDGTRYELARNAGVKLPEYLGERREGTDGGGDEGPADEVPFPETEARDE